MNLYNERAGGSCRVPASFAMYRLCSLVFLLSTAGNQASLLHHEGKLVEQPEVLGNCRRGTLL